MPKFHEQVTDQNLNGFLNSEATTSDTCADRAGGAWCWPASCRRGRHVGLFADRTAVWRAVPAMITRRNGRNRAVEGGDQRSAGGLHNDGRQS